jgi:alpha-glucosidase (family GH31 glycosyl hydrolase)
MTDPNRMEIPLLDGEYWWGGVVRHGDQMPFGPDSQYAKDLYGQLDGNQGCPFLVSSRGRYVWSEEPFAFEFRNGALAIHSARGQVDFQMGFDDLRGAYLAACGRHFPPSGRIPDELSFTAPQYNGWIQMKWEPTQQKVLDFAQDILDHGMPPGVLMIDDMWFHSNGDWTFHAGRFPNPRAMADRLHALGFKLVVWICPYITADTYVYRRLKERRFLLPRAGAKDEPAICRWWNGYSAMLDLLNPAAAAWFQEQMDHLVERDGVDGFKFDGGDAYTYATCDIDHGIRRPNALNEAFGRMGLKYSLSEYRACWKLGGHHLIQRVRDKGHRWEAGGMADLLPTGLAQGLAGYPFTCPDMVGGGLVGDFVDPGTRIDQELFVRYCQCSTLFPIMQFSTMPWRVLDSEHLEACMRMVELKKRLAGEVLALAWQAGRTGEPIMRHMAYEFPRAELETVRGQFMLGGDILVAPVLEPGAREKTIHFPPGLWEGDDGSIVDGPATLEVPAPLDRLPWYRRRR